MESIKGKWTLVTGASRGVGRQIALGLAPLGCHLILHARQKPHLEEVVKQLGRTPGDVVKVEAELSEPDAVRKMLEEVDSIAPQIDILYNNAAIGSQSHSDLWSFSREEYRQSFEVNVISLAMICYHMLPGMIERGWGRVINTTSGIRDQPNLMPYALSKAAVDKFVADFVKTLDGTGVGMNTLDPGWLKTDMGGPNAMEDVETVLPGALVPALISKPVNGVLFRAQQYKGMTLEEAVGKAETE